MAKKQDTPGHGIEYEIFVPAFFALKLNNDARVRDFSIRSNVSTEFGKLDDVVIDVILRDDTTRHFAFQLKHKEKKHKRLLPASFEAKGNFNLEKYHESFKQLQDDRKKRYHFILYTNAQFDGNKCEQGMKYTMSQDNEGIGSEFFNTGGSVYKFEANDSNPEFNTFLSQFKLYTCQKNFQDLENDICDILRHKNVVFHFLDLFRKWHQGRFSNKVVNRKIINIHLIDAFLSQFWIRNYYPKTQLFEAIITEFDMSVMKDGKTQLDEIHNFDDYFKNVSMTELEYGPDILKRHGTDQTSAINEWLLRMAKEYKLVEKTETNTDDETKLKVIFYLLKKIIIIDFNENSKNLFCQTMELYNMKQINLKFLLLVYDAERPAIPNMRIFQNLEDVSKNNRVLYEKLVRTCKVLLHGREIVLEEFIKHFDKASSVIETNDILKMLQGQFLVREDREILPPFYISRKVSTHVFNKETVFNYARDTSNLILINFAGDMNQNLHVFRENRINIKKLEDYTKEETMPQYPVVLSTDDFSEKMFQDIRKKFSGKNIYFLKTLSEDIFVITRSNKSIQELKPQLKNDKMDEEKLINIFNTSVNILVGQPGMGKSTMMKYLKNNCDWDMWTINVILQAHTSFFKKNHTTEEVLEYFISLTTNNTFTMKLVRLFENKRKIVLFLDGLDELESACIDNVLRHVETLSKMGFCIWISSREHLIEKLETTFGKFCINITELTKNEQQNYIQERLENHYTEEEIQYISQQIFQSYEFMENQAILGIPLQLYIITQIFLDSEKRSLSFTKNMFVVTKLYKMFFEGRYQHEMRKNSSNTLFDDCEDYLQRYEILALETLFKSEILLPLKLDSRQSERFVRKIRTGKDIIGIIVSVNSEGKPIFQHHTFAEYFACVFFCNNFDKSRIVKDHLLSDEYQNLLLLLNMMLAENNPLHLAVIYKNVEHIQLHMESVSHHDVAGRNPLHISVMHSNCTYATVSCTDRWDGDGSWFLSSGSRDDSPTNKNIIEQLVLQCDPFEKDILFENDAFHCAVTKNSLFAIEKILKYKGVSRETFETLQRFGFVNNPTIAYHATLWAYPNLLSVALDKKHSLITIISVTDGWRGRNLWSVLAHSKSNTLDKNETGLLMHTFGVPNKYDSLEDAVVNNDLNLVKLFLDTSNNFSKDQAVVYWAVISKNKRMVEYLLSKGFNVNGKYFSKTAIHAAVETQQLDMLKLLITCEGDINAVDGDKNTVLHYASKVGNKNITTFILSKSVDVNAINKSGETALNIAVENNDIAIARLLLKNGASLMENGDPYVFTPLQKAVLNGKYEMVCLLLQHKANEKIVTTDGTTVLHLAAAGGNVNIARLFLERNWSVNIENNVGATPLFFACGNGHLNMCKLLLRNDANVNFVTHLGNTLLHWAAEGGNCEILALLLQNNENINAENNCGETPIYIAVKNGRIDAVKMFVKLGARINMETIRILLKIYYRHYSHEDFEFLLKKMIEDGADPNWKCHQEDATLLSEVIDVGNFELAQFLLERGANVNDMRAFRKALYCYEWKQFLELLFNKGFTPSSIQEYEFSDLRYDQYDIIKYLLDKGVPINIFNIFHDAVMGNNYQLVDLCLETEIDIDVKQSDGRTALFNAASDRNFAMMKYLLEKGGDPNCKTNDGSTIWKQVIMYCNKDFLEYLLTKEIDINSENKQGETALYFALERNDQQIIQSLINNGARFNNLKLLHKAAKMNNFLMVKMFFDINKKRKAYIDSQIFLEACIDGNCEIIDFLLKQEFKVNTANDQSETALLLSAKNKKFEAVKLLVLRGADVNCISKSRETIWKHIQYCEQNLKKLIYSRNVNLSLENEKKKTPLFYAIKNEDVFILEHLVKDKFIQFFDVMSISEANLCQNAHIVKILEKRTNYRSVRTTQHLAQNFYDEIFCPFSIHCNFSEEQNDIYRRLHFAVYTGNVGSVQRLIDNRIDMDSVDIYNDQYPLHFAVNNGRLERDLLIQMTGKIGDLYCEFRRHHPRYKLRHMRRYLLNSYPLDQHFKQKRKQKYIYLFEKFKTI